MPLYAHRFATPLGDLLAVVDGAGALVRLDFVDGPDDPDLPDGVRWSSERCAGVAAELGEYFRGARRSFDLTTAPAGTPFQRAVWSALLDIPYGHTVSYGELARRVGCGSARPVGRAVGANPIAVVLPCHRVVGGDGSLTGYAAGLERKRSLLALEGARATAPQRAAGAR